MYEPLLVRKHVTPYFLLLLLDQVHVREHPVRLEAGGELGGGCGVEVKAGQRD